MIVEFVGQVGGGKTTNCIYFSKLLQEKGFEVYVLGDLNRYFHSRSYSYRFYLILKTLFIHGVDLIHFTLILAKSGIYSIDSIIRYSKLCVKNVTLREFRAKKQFDLLLLDQWIIQGLWSATIFKIKSYDMLPYKLRKFYFKTDMVLYFNIDNETAAKRIADRDTNTSRFDRMNTERRLLELNRYYKYLYQLYVMSNCKFKLEFSAIESPQKNAEDFLRQYTRLVNYK